MSTPSQSHHSPCLAPCTGPGGCHLQQSNLERARRPADHHGPTMWSELPMNKDGHYLPPGYNLYRASKGRFYAHCKKGRASAALARFRLELFGDVKRNEPETSTLVPPCGSICKEERDNVAAPPPSPTVGIILLLLETTFLAHDIIIIIWCRWRKPPTTRSKDVLPEPV